MRRQQFRTSQTALRGPINTHDPVQLVHSFDYGINPSKPVKSSPLGSSTIAGLPLELLGRLKAFPLFKSAPESFLLSIGRSLRPNIFQASQEIIREGEDARAMYWLVRGGVKVTSRDGESTYAELRPGSFFGEIGILMDMPRTATIVATVRSLVVRLNKEDLQKELPQYPLVERAIREEALERLAILEKTKKERITKTKPMSNTSIITSAAAPRKRSRDWIAGDVEMGEAGMIADGQAQSNKRRKSPSPSIADIAATTAIGTDPPLTVRHLLKEMPLFASLPDDVLHFLGINARQVTFAPFTDIIKQGSFGRDVFFMIKGEVEVLQREAETTKYSKPQLEPPAYERVRLRVRARLKAGQFFGEVVNLSLSPKRTATVRSINTAECLVITGEVLDELWQRSSPALRQQVEAEGRRRLAAAGPDKHDLMLIDEDSEMVEEPLDDSDDAMPDDGTAEVHWRAALPTVKVDDELANSLSKPPKLEPLDPDPFFNADLDNMRAKSRRTSLAPQVPGTDGHISPPHDKSRTPSPPLSHWQIPSPLRPRGLVSTSPTKLTFTSPPVTRRPSLVRLPTNAGTSRLPDSIVVMICQHLDLLDLMRLRLVSMHWHHLLTTSPNILKYLDLSSYNRHITDDVLKNSIIPFVGSRPARIDLSNCFHITDEGFKALADSCGDGVTMWKMKSVWDVSGPAVLSMVDKAKGLEEIDLSNCRKVGDNLLARVVGWIVPAHKTPPQTTQPPAPSKRAGMSRHTPAGRAVAAPVPPPPGTVIGAPKLKRLTLSYCKHIQDRSMTHLAMHASDRLESLDLTRCTSISDAGFHSWGIYSFRNMRRLILADCTYLSDQAIVGVVGGCRGLLELDLSFCCALSDTATEVLALGLPALRRLNMAFCGSAISDNSMRCIGLHLLELRYLSVRGCVRVTGQGVEGVIEGCTGLEEFDVSQCKNLRPWLDRGGVRMVNGAAPHGHGRNIVFDVVADGTWRA